MEIIKDGIYAVKQIFGFFLGVIWWWEDDDDRGAAGFDYICTLHSHFMMRGYSCRREGGEMLTNNLQDRCGVSSNSQYHLRNRSSIE